VKLFALLLISSPISIIAQDPNQNGIRMGRPQTVFLVEPAQRTTLVDFLAKLRRESGGRDLQLDSLDLTDDGAGMILFPPMEPTPRADFETWVEGIGKQYLEGVNSGFSSIRRESARVLIERFVRDEFRHVYIRYAVSLEMLPESGTYRASFSEATTAAPPVLPAAWMVLAPSHDPVPQILRDGDIIPLELYGTATGQRLVEYLHVGQKSPVFRKEAAREIYTDVAEFSLDQPKFRINGVSQLVATREALHGPLLSIYVPGRGRFQVSLKARPGFLLAGEVAGDSLWFSENGNLFRLDTAERIAEAGSGTYRVYVQRDAGWTPTDQSGSQVLIATGK